MPNRIIREGWIESLAIDQLDAFAERFFLRLCLKADDFGRYSAHPTLLKSHLFPLSENVRSTDIPRWLAACEKAGLVRCYEADAKPFLEIVKFGQRIKENTRSKFPAPPGCAPINQGQSSLFPDDPGQSRTGPPYSEAEAESKRETSSPCPDSASPNPDGERFVVWFLELLAETGAPTPKLTPSNRASWADSYDKMIRLDGRTKELVKEVCRWARNDAFWRKNFLSPMKLRDKKDGVMLFDAFLAKMGADRTYAPSVARPDIYTEPADWRDRFAKKLPDAPLPATWEEISSSLRNDLVYNR